MLAARLHKIGEPMRLERIPAPKPRPTDVVVAVKACGVVPNLANVLVHWNTWFPELPLPKLPAIFGLDVAGEVAEAGELVQHYRKGDRVYVNPGLSCGSCPACRADEPLNCINFTFNDDEPALRQQLRVPAQNTTQDVYASAPLKTGRIMAKDEDMCLHCGLCAERCPTGAWDMQKFMYVEAQASEACLTHHNAYLR